MNKSQKDNQTIEDQLAYFTDRILEKTTEADIPKLDQEPELRALEKTAQQLKNAFHDEGPSEAAIQQMRENILLEWKQRESRASKPFWRRLLVVLKPGEQRWQSQRNRQRWNTVTSLAVASGVMLVTILFLNKDNSVQPAASGQTFNPGILAAVSLLLLVFLWIFRRKL